MKHIKKQASTEVKQDPHLQLASEQSAMHATQLAVARWTSGNTYVEMQLAKTLRPSVQSEWYDATQRNFRAWLAKGGFAGCREQCAY